MKKKSLTSRHVCRFSDLDTQRHVTSRTYENFCQEARFQVLEKLGITWRDLVEKNEWLHPVNCYYRFANQQMPGATVVVKTEAWIMEDGYYFWRHMLQTKDGKHICEIQLLSFLGKEQPRFNEGPKRLPNSHKMLKEPLLFKGNNKRISFHKHVYYSERDAAGLFPVVAYWRLWEEARWRFVEELGLSYEYLRESDTISFLMGANCQFHRPISEGQDVVLNVWTWQFDKIRWYLRVEMCDLDGNILATQKEEQLMVSLSKARPKKAPQQLLDINEPYTEYRG